MHGDMLCCERPADAEPLMDYKGQRLRCGWRTQPAVRNAYGSCMMGPGVSRQGQPAHTRNNDKQTNCEPWLPQKKPGSPGIAHKTSGRYSPGSRGNALEPVKCQGVSQTLWLSSQCTSYQPLSTPCLQTWALLRSRCEQCRIVARQHVLRRVLAAATLPGCYQQVYYHVCGLHCQVYSRRPDVTLISVQAVVAWLGRGQQTAGRQHASLAPAAGC
jgi:hypothetical protein